MYNRAIGIVVAAWLGLSGGCAMSEGRDAGGGMDAGGTDAGGIDAGGGACSPACDTERACCAGECTNLENDPRNCGACGTECEAGDYCTGGTCEPVPCTATCGGAETCCGGACCDAGQICCDPQGPVSTGPTCVAPDARGTCPVGCAPLCMCAAPDTLIATPSGERTIASLNVGDLVYSVHEGATVAVPIAAIHRQPVSAHRVVRVTLEGGAILEMTSGHPTADGRTFADLGPGALLDGARVVDAEEVPYPHPFTYDILPASDTGTYFAAGARVGSTLPSCTW